MKKMISILLILGLTVAPALASQFDRYTQMTQDELSRETREISKEIQSVFNEKNMDASQAKIDFSEYISNLKKVVLYGTRLAVYADHEADLEFARENALFKGLPDSPDTAKNKDKSAFVSKKYQQMKVNVKEEISTYQDLILLGLESCESQMDSDLSHILDQARFQDRMRTYLATHPDYKRFQERQADLERAWPELARRIRLQISLWQVRGASPASPLIDPHITEAIIPS